MSQTMFCELRALRHAQSARSRVSNDERLPGPTEKVTQVELAVVSRNRGVSYGPAPVKKAGSPINGDDYMADITGAMWADWGRGDLELIKQLGGNTIRMYGSLALASFLDFPVAKSITKAARPCRQRCKHEPQGLPGPGL